MTEITNAEGLELVERLGIKLRCGPNVLGCSGRKNGNPTKKCIGCDALVYPNFRDARVPLRLAMEREDWPKLLDYILLKWVQGEDEPLGFEIPDSWIMLQLIPAELMLNQTGQLAKLLLEWLRKGEGK